MLLGIMPDMVPWWLILITAWIAASFGVIVGLIIFALCAVAKEADRHINHME